ncbi:MAG: hypothetical protein ABR975_06785 [Vulcanimicrobiaceae bacterium]|jgi:hypothetical protein
MHVHPPLVLRSLLAALTLFATTALAPAALVPDAAATPQMAATQILVSPHVTVLRPPSVARALAAGMTIATSDRSCAAERTDLGDEHDIEATRSRALFHHDTHGWRLVTSGGGSLGVIGLHQDGISTSAACTLLGNDDPLCSSH